MVVDDRFRPSSRHFSRMSYTLKQCSRSDFWPYRMSATIVRGGRILVNGINKMVPGVSKDIRYDKDRGIHAELDAVLQAARLGIATEGASIYIAGVSKGNNLIMSAPCELCQQVIREAGIKDIFYWLKTGAIVRVRV